MNVPMYDREKERELDKTLAEKEARWERAGLLTRQPNQNIFASTPKSVYADPNTVPELQMSLEVAYNMWLVRFGAMWVKTEDVQDADGFRWPQIATRLRDMRLVEHLTNTGHYRLVPHVWK